jgi:hypothetical protein
MLLHHGREVGRLIDWVGGWVGGPFAWDMSHRIGAGCLATRFGGRTGSAGSLLLVNSSRLGMQSIVYGRRP